MSSISGRKDWIDFARAIGIFCIAYGHLVQGESVVSQYFGSFRVAIFFLIMGLTFSIKDSFFCFLKKKVFRLLIPYAFFSVVSIIAFYFFAIIMPSLTDGKTNNILIYFWGAIYGNGLTGNMKWNLPLWFLPCSFVTLLLVYGYEKLLMGLKLNKLLFRIVYFFVSASICFVYICFIKNAKLPFGAEVAISMSGFVELGIVLSKIDSFKKKYLYGLICIPLIICGYCLCRINGVVSVMSLNFGSNYVIYYISSVASIVGIICLSIWLCSFELLKSINRIACYCGKHTIAILCMHKFPILFFQLIVPYTKVLFRSESGSVQKDVLGILVTIVVIALCLIVELPINRFLPQVLGNSNKQKGVAS